MVADGTLAANRVVRRGNPSSSCLRQYVNTSKICVAKISRLPFRLEHSGRRIPHFHRVIIDLLSFSGLWGRGEPVITSTTKLTRSLSSMVL